MKPTMKSLERPTISGLLASRLSFLLALCDYPLKWRRSVFRQVSPLQGKQMKPEHSGPWTTSILAIPSIRSLNYVVLFPLLLGFYFSIYGHYFWTNNLIFFGFCAGNGDVGCSGKEIPSARTFSVSSYHIRGREISLALSFSVEPGVLVEGSEWWMDCKDGVNALPRSRGCSKWSSHHASWCFSQFPLADTDNRAPLSTLAMTRSIERYISFIKRLYGDFWW